VVISGRVDRERRQRSETYAGLRACGELPPATSGKNAPPPQGGAHRAAGAHTEARKPATPQPRTAIVLPHPHLGDLPPYHTLQFASPRGPEEEWRLQSLVVESLRAFPYANRIRRADAGPVPPVSGECPGGQALPIRLATFGM